MWNICTESLSLLALTFAASASASEQTQGDWVALELPSEALDRWVLELSWRGEDLEVELWRAPIRAAQYRVREMAADGSLREVARLPRSRRLHRFPLRRGDVTVWSI